MPIPPEKGGELSPGSLASADVESSRASKMFTVLGKMAPEAGRAGGVRDGLGLEAPQLPGGALWSGASSWGASEACMGRLPQLPTLPASFLPPTTHPSLYFTPQQKALVVGKTWGGAVLTLMALVPVWRVGAVWPPTPQLSAESFPWTCPQLERGPRPTLSLAFQGPPRPVPGQRRGIQARPPRLSWDNSAWSPRSGAPRRGRQRSLWPQVSKGLQDHLPAHEALWPQVPSGDPSGDGGQAQGRRVGRGADAM